MSKERQSQIEIALKEIQPATAEEIYAKVPFSFFSGGIRKTEDLLSVMVRGNRVKRVKDKKYRLTTKDDMQMNHAQNSLFEM